MPDNLDTVCVRRHGEYEVSWKCPRCEKTTFKTYDSKEVAEKIELGLLEGWLSALCEECTNAPGL